MEYLELLDNTEANFIPSSRGIGEEAFHSFASMSNISLEKLCRDNPGLVVLSSKFDDIKDSNLVNLYGIDFDRKVHASTGNLMGFVGRNDFRLSIRSRFSVNGSEDGQHLDYFLHYMLMKVYSINLFYMPFNLERNGNLNILMYMFPCYLQRALSQGVYKTYSVQKMNDSRPRGVIDVSMHIRENIPFRGNISYTMRTSSFDNDVTELIRHTIEYLKTDPVGKALLKQNKEIIDAVNLITQVTGSYQRGRRSQIISRCLKPFAHPYFSKYRELIKLCLMILRFDRACYGLDKDKTYGILFDGAWLWEEYLATILKDMGFKHPLNRLGIGGIKVNEGRFYYPDFYYGSQIKEADVVPECNMIVDAKYKNLGYGIDRNDLNQMITYLHILPARKAYLLYPRRYMAEYGETKKLYGLGGTVQTIGFPIPQEASSMKDFASQMNVNEFYIRNYFKTQILGQ